MQEARGESLDLQLPNGKCAIQIALEGVVGGLQHLPVVEKKAERFQSEHEKLHNASHLLAVSVAADGLYQQKLVGAWGGVSAAVEGSKQPAPETELSSGHTPNR